MGLDCPNVKRIIHLGPLMTWSLTSKKQEETGMQLQLSCTTYGGMNIAGVKVTQQMHEYCKLKDSSAKENFCRGILILWIANCKCCDFCILSCTCIDCW